ncbi:hypothetical protein CVT25_002491 [Psilocybe cyanescens]|uniref:DUF7330 domain-containing protein n=1 Tax=Psilocybe cyanescens TaxID=93625 RepID=A0A409XUB1_PSICY|nr:hypothetical protein CVT25_002491 [Psilocybe cyanescens]
MILVPESGSAPKTKSEEANLERAPEVNMEDPPPYVDSQEGSSTIQPPSRALPNIRPSNFVCLSRQNDSVKGSWIIDPTMVIPSAFLPSVPEDETEQTRSNISLSSKNGAVSADIFVLPTSNHTSLPITHRKQIIIRGASHNGSVTLKIHEIASEGKRLPMQIHGFSANGNINIYVPRSFQGPVSVKLRNGNLRFSETVKASVTQFSEMNGMQRSFIGDFDANAIQNAGEWAGDTLSLESRNGSVKVYFDDEVDEPTRLKSQSFLGRLFSF